jgi:sirohydrochlorin ferrochelatase
MTDHAILAALIPVGAALLGFATAAWTTAMSSRASREAAQDQRLWEKRSALYVDILAEVASREYLKLEQRGHGTPDGLRQIREAIETHPTPIRTVYEARIRAYATPELLSAFLADGAATDEVRAAEMRLERNLASDDGSEAAERQDRQAQRLEDAAARARETSEALTDLIRRELQPGRMRWFRRLVGHRPAP